MVEIPTFVCSEANWQEVVVSEGHHVTYPPKMIYVGVEEAIAALKGETGDLPRKTVVPADVITPENAADFYFPDSIY